MNIKTLIIFILYSSSLSFSFVEESTPLKVKLENSREVNIPSTQDLDSQFNILPKNKRNIPPFNFGSFLEDKSKFEKFISENFKIFDISSPEEVQEALRSGSKNLILKSYFKQSPLISEFIFRSLKDPEGIAKFLSLFLEFNKMIGFSVFIICSFIFSHFLGEYKFNYDVLSPQRIAFSIFRIGIINSLRIGVFSILFSDHLKPILQTYAQSAIALRDSYPLLSSFCEFIV